MKREKDQGGKKWLPFLAALLIVIAGFSLWAAYSSPALKSHLGKGWRNLAGTAGRILGLKKREEVPPEERRIRENVVLKKMEEASAQQDWKSFAPEYPRPKRIEAATDEAKLQALKESTEFKELEKEYKEFLKKKEDQLLPEPPVPSLKDAAKLPPIRDRGAEKIVEALLPAKESPPQERALEENLRLGMKGPLAARKILERPPPPNVKVKMEMEIEMTIWVLPSGMVNRVLPAIKGDAELERVATQYLKQWRFAPLPSDQPQAEQWGTIPIKFKLQ